jgi:hypothetical protein
LITILRSTGPVISTRRHSSACGIGAIFQSPLRSRRSRPGSPGARRHPGAGALDAGGQQLLAARLELTAELGYEGERLGRQDLFVAGLDLGTDLHSGRGGDGHGISPSGWRLLSRQVYSLWRH